MRRCLVALPIGTVVGLDNGLGLTPPMGFISWERFGAETNCKKFPDTCISENLYRSIAQAMVDKGLRDAGYVYVNIDDNWSARTRDAAGRLTEDPERFPSGMKALSKYIHGLDLKFGMYTDVGTATCQGYPGLLKRKHTKWFKNKMRQKPSLASKLFESLKSLSLGFTKIDLEESNLEDKEFYESDIDMFLDWGIDALKVDGCYAEIPEMAHLYPAMSQMIQSKIKERENKGVPVNHILLSCSWPAYVNPLSVKESKPIFDALIEHCNLWRNYGDIQDSWDSVKSIANFFARTSASDPMVQAAGPGHWNDPDMLVLGNNGLSLAQQQSQMAIWAILAAPLYISADIRKLSPEVLKILTNAKVIAVNQDPLGKQGWVVHQDKVFRVWVKPLSPNGSGQTCIAVVIENFRTEFNATPFNFVGEKLFGTTIPSFKSGSFTMENLIEDDKPNLGRFEADTTQEILIDENSVAMFKVVHSQGEGRATN